MFLAVLEDFPFIETFTAHDRRFYDFGSHVTASVHLHFRHFKQKRNHFFHFPGNYLQTEYTDHFRQSAEQEYPPSRINLREITCLKPAAGHGVTIDCAAFEITRHHRRGANAQYLHRIRILDTRPAQRDFHASHRRANATIKFVLSRSYRDASGLSRTVKRANSHFASMAKCIKGFLS